MSDILTRDEAYTLCKSKMNYAADKIRQAALAQGFGYYMAVTTPVGAHGGWMLEHSYWLSCMRFVEAQPENIQFRIDGEFLCSNIEGTWETYYAY